MPLAFDSVSHGTVAFGFFNIDSDMLLLENYFLFATEFCGYISEMAEKNAKGVFESVWQIWQIDDAKDIGDLMGAIHRLRHTGFIGELYRKFPFPEKPEDFKQKPQGFKNRAITETIIEKYAKPVEIPFAVDKEEQDIRIGAYRFTRSSFQDMIRYVWRGGYPRWKDEIMPDYVMTMNKTIAKSRKQLFKGIVSDS